MWEWCRDYYKYEFYKEFPHQLYNSQESKQRVLRGGSWANVKRRLRTSNRLGSAEGTRNDNFGFRMVMEPIVTGITK